MSGDDNKKNEIRKLDDAIVEAMRNGVIDEIDAGELLARIGGSVAGGYRQGGNYNQRSGDFNQGKGGHKQGGDGGYTAGRTIDDLTQRRDGGRITIDDLDLDVARELGLIRNFRG